MSTVQIILLSIATYFILFASILQTTNIQSAIVVKFIPMISAILLILVAFDLIK